jgi:hypothetical protein
MKCSIPKKEIYIKLFEFVILTILAFLFLSDGFSTLFSSIESKPEWLDHWSFCYRLQNEVTRILGLNPGGIWDGGTYYPFHRISILFDETSWGVSLFIAPIWMVTRNIFSIFYLGGIFSILLLWVSIYYFVKSLGGTRICSFFAGAMSCLAGISMILISFHCVFWPFFFIPLLGIITLKIFSTSRLYWGVLWGLLYGYLAWSSAHLFVMGGVFLSLFILWNLLFNNRSRKVLLALLAGFVISGFIAGVVLGAIYLTYNKLGFYREYSQFHDYASNWANLIYKSFPPMPFNPLAQIPFWEYLKTQAKGEIEIGISILLLFSTVFIFIFRLKEPISSRAVNKHPKRALVAVVIMAVTFAFLNMQALVVRCRQSQMPLPNLATGLTCLYYVTAGIIIYIFRNRIKSAIKHPDFFLLLTALFFGLLAFGPYYLTKNNLVVASPVAFLQYHIPGFSGIRATARWGLLLVFTLAIAVAMFLSKNAKTRLQQICAVIFMLLAILEVWPGFRIPNLKNLSPYQWTPRETDIFLKNLPDGAVLEISAYPVDYEQRLSSDNSTGYALFSRLYHKKPLVNGYASFWPKAMNTDLFGAAGQTLSAEEIDKLRKFGARYWVVHIENIDNVESWSPEERQLFKDDLRGLKKIGELDKGKTLVYEDPDPKVSVVAGRYP